MLAQTLDTLRMRPAHRDLPALDDASPHGLGDVADDRHPTDCRTASPKTHEIALEMRAAGAQRNHGRGMREVQCGRALATIREGLRFGEFRCAPDAQSVASLLKSLFGRAALTDDDGKCVERLLREFEPKRSDPVPKLDECGLSALCLRHPEVLTRFLKDTWGAIRLGRMPLPFVPAFLLAYERAVANHPDEWAVVHHAREGAAVTPYEDLVGECYKQLWMCEAERASCEARGRPLKTRVAAYLSVVGRYSGHSRFDYNPSIVTPMDCPGAEQDAWMHDARISNQRLKAIWQCYAVLGKIDKTWVYRPDISTIRLQSLVSFNQRLDCAVKDFGDSAGADVRWAMSLAFLDTAAKDSRCALLANSSVLVTALRVHFWADRTGRAVKSPEALVESAVRWLRVWLNAGISDEAVKPTLAEMDRLDLWTKLNADDCRWRKQTVAMTAPQAIAKRLAEVHGEHAKFERLEQEVRRAFVLQSDAQATSGGALAAGSASEPYPFGGRGCCVIT
ncbi:hypothetical protein GCM10027419_42830 [Pandoraea terrae]